MIKDNVLKERVKFFLLGVLMVLGALFLMGNSGNQLFVDNGRFQISAWGDGQEHGAFIVDSVTGNTKMVYRYKEVDGGKPQGKNMLNRPFNKIKY